MTSNRYNTAESEGLASARQILKSVPQVNARRIEPSCHVYQGKAYTTAIHTDLSKTMAQYRLAFGGKA